MRFWHVKQNIVSSVSYISRFKYILYGLYVIMYIYMDIVSLSCELKSFLESEALTTMLQAINQGRRNL